MKPHVFATAAFLFAALATPIANAAADSAVSEAFTQVAGSKLVIIGEMHGTQEAPALVADLSRRWLEEGGAGGESPLVIVALEYPQSNALELQRYVDSDGSANEVNRLLESPFWSRPFQDGRSSVAILELIDAVRVQFRRGARIELAAIDLSASQIASKLDRDQAMAINLRAVVQKNPQSRVIALVGNYHARQAVGAPWNADFHFMASYLRHLSPLSLMLQARRGDYWGCSSAAAADCKKVGFALNAREGAAVGPVRRRQRQGDWL